MNSAVFGDYLSRRGWHYESVDRWRGGNPADPRDVSFISHELDLCDLSPLRSGSFDLLIAQHVIEEIREHQKALDEISRVAKPKALALLEIPFSHHTTHSVAHEPDSFGNVWRFGTDILEEVRRRFLHVELVALSPRVLYEARSWPPATREPTATAGRHRLC